MKNKFLPWFVAAGFALLFFSTLFAQKSPQIPTQQPAQIAPATEAGPSVSQNSAAETQKEISVKRVIDGDTIELEDGTRVRYIGMDTPEAGDCFGQEAARENRKLVEGKRVRLETDVQKLDKYSRLLAYVFVDEIFVNEELVRRGVAQVLTYPPDVKYTEKFVAAQEEAKNKNAGLWDQTSCSGSKGDAFRSYPPESSENQAESSQSTQSGCVIKGNISSSGEKIYHIPGQRYYEKTKIEENKGERWFCTEGEAQSAGWRKSKV